MGVLHTAGYSAIVSAASLVFCASVAPLGASDATAHWFARTSPPAVVSMFIDEEFQSPRLVRADFKLAAVQPAEFEGPVAAPDNEPQQPFEIAVGARAWFSRGRSEMTIAGSVGPPFCPETRYVDVLSELQWKRIDSVVTELNAEVLIYRQVVVQFTVGLGGASAGTFDDFDYCAPGRQELMSHTFHPVQEGEIRSLGIDVGLRYFETPWCWLEVLLGHQHHAERYVAVDGVDLFPGSRTATFQGQTVITQEYTWNAFRMGGRAHLQVLPRLALRGSCFVSPANQFRLTDVHHLRDDLRQDPSIVGRAKGGWGFSARAAVIYRLWRDMFVEVGYQILRYESGTGESTARTNTGDAVNPLSAQMFRHGFSIGGRYEF